MLGILRYALCRLAEIDLLDGRPEEAIARLADIDGPLESLYDVLFLAVLAEAHLEAGEPAEGLRLAERAVARSETMRNRLEGLDARRVLARCLRAMGETARSEALLRSTLAEAVTLPCPPTAARLRQELAAQGAAR